jgi:hypothetical protein
MIGAVLALTSSGAAGCADEPAPPTPIEGAADAQADAVVPTVTVFVAREAQEAGVTVRAATRGRSSDEGNEIRLALAFAKPLEARVLLQALDDGNVELGRAKSPNLGQPAGSTTEVSVFFRRALSLERIHHCNMELIPQKAVVVSGDAAGPAELVRGKDKEPPEIRLGRVLEEVGPPIRVRIDVAFVTPFEGELQLRANDTRGAEVGRSQKAADLAAEAGATRTFDFVFHETLSARFVESYELYVRGSAGLKKPKKKR